VTGYVARHVDAHLDDLLGGLPALMLTGPRGCGKTTTAERRAAAVIRLDDDEQALAFQGDPESMLLAARCPVLIDEWQQVPGALSAVKRIVDKRHGPAQFLITGSVRSRLMKGAWPATGRVVPVRMWGMTEAELSGHPETTLDWLWHPESLAVGSFDSAPTVLGYAEALVAGGFPEARGLAPRHRAAWYEGYVDHMIHRDVAPLADVRTPLSLGRLLTAVGINTAGLPSVATLAEAARIDQRTAAAYLDTLEDLRLIQRVQPWFRNPMTQMVKTPKYYVTDAGLAAYLNRADQGTLIANGTLLGRLIDTFVAAQLRPLLDLATPRIELCHLRSIDGRREVDLVLDAGERGLVGIEVKAAAAVSAADARHLAWLRDQIAGEFAAGYVLHTGRLTHSLGDKLWAVPIAALWQPGGARGAAMM